MTKYHFYRRDKENKEDRWKLSYKCSDDDSPKDLLEEFRGAFPDQEIKYREVYKREKEDI